MTPSSSSATSELASQPKPAFTRVIIPSEAFTMICVTLMKHSDALLDLVRAFCAEAKRQDDAALLDRMTPYLTAANIGPTALEQMLRACLEESHNGSPSQPS